MQGPISKLDPTRPSPKVKHREDIATRQCQIRAANTLRAFLSVAGQAGLWSWELLLKLCPAGPVHPVSQVETRPCQRDGDCSFPILAPAALAYPAILPQSPPRIWSSPP